MSQMDSFAPSTRYELLTLGEQVAVHAWTRSDADPGRPMLIAHHGWTDSGEVFAVLARQLTSVCDVYGVDAPGHGRSRTPISAAPGVDSVMPSALAAVDGVVRLTGGRRPVVLMGHSMGALPAARTAALRPRQVQWLVLEEPPRRALLPRHDVRREIAGLSRLQAMSHEGRVRFMSEFAGWSPEELDVWSRSKVDAVPEMLHSLRNWGEPLTQTLARITCPVTVVLGSGRRSLTNRRRAAAYRAASRSRFEIVRLDSGHNPRRDDPVGFVAAMTRIMETVSAASSPI